MPGSSEDRSSLLKVLCDTTAGSGANWRLSLWQISAGIIESVADGMARKKHGRRGLHTGYVGSRLGSESRRLRLSKMLMEGNKS